MKTANKLEETLNGGYAGLYGEVVTSDCYRLKQVKFIPDIIFDVGGNIGVFARYARELFPKAIIVSVEPNPSNCANFRKFTPDGNNTYLWQAALGQGKVYHGLTARNGSGETYLSPGLGYPLEALKQTRAEHPGVIEESDVQVITLDDLVYAFNHQGMQMLLKVDCEGGENSIWQHKESMDVLRKMDYICMEVHFYAINGKYSDEVRKVTEEALNSLKLTHDCELDGVHFWATKKT